LNDEYVMPANVFLDPHVGLAVWERTDRRLTQRDADIFANPFGQIAIGRAAKNFEFWLKGKHRECLTLGARKLRWQPSKLAGCDFFGE
jgi:hypothetical protein